MTLLCVLTGCPNPLKDWTSCQLCFLPGCYLQKSGAHSLCLHRACLHKFTRQQFIHLLSSPLSLGRHEDSHSGKEDYTPSALQRAVNTPQHTAFPFTSVPIFLEHSELCVRFSLFMRHNEGNKGAKANNAESRSWNEQRGKTQSSSSGLAAFAWSTCSVPL